MQLEYNGLIKEEILHKDSRRIASFPLRKISVAYVEHRESSAVQNRKDKIWVCKPVTTC